MSLTQVLENKYKLNNGVNFDNHNMVKDFYLYGEKANKETMIKAYICRDLYYSGNLTVIQLFEKHIKKLGYNPTPEGLLNRNKCKLINEFKNSLLCNSQTDISIDFLKQIVDDIYNKCTEFTLEEETNKERALTILEMASSGKHPFEIYNEFTMDELGYLGW